MRLNRRSLGAFLAIILTFAFFSSAPAFAEQPGAKPPAVTKPDAAKPTDAKPVLVPADMAKALEQAFKDVQQAKTVLSAAQAQAQGAESSYRATYFEIMATLGLSPQDYEMKADKDGTVQFVKRAPATARSAPPLQPQTPEQGAP